MSRDMVYEVVPQLSRRVGDTVIAGGNNSSILLGRDRLGSTSTGYGSVSAPGGGKGAGAMHLTVGRRSEDPSIGADAASIYLSQKTDADVAADTLSVGSPRQEVSAVICRADCIRMVPRQDFKLTVGSAYISVTSDGRVVLEGDISLGKNAAKRLVSEDFAAFWSTVVIVSPSGPCNPLPPIPLNCFTTKTKSE